MGKSKRIVNSVTLSSKICKFEKKLKDRQKIIIPKKEIQKIQKYQKYKKNKLNIQTNGKWTKMLQNFKIKKK